MAVKLQLFVIDGGRCEVNDMSLFSPGLGQENVHLTMPVPCYLIKHLPSGKSLIWDSGCCEQENPYKRKDGKLSLYGGLVAKQLKDLGVPPSDVNFAAFSHMHNDHAGNANLFTNSTLLLQQDEYDAAFADEHDAKNHEIRCKCGFRQELFIKLKDNPRKIYIGDYDVFSDGSVIIKRAPGHTPGHQVLVIHLPQTGSILLSGDLWHTALNKEKKGCTTSKL